MFLLRCVEYRPCAGPHHALSAFCKLRQGTAIVKITNLPNDIGGARKISAQQCKYCRAQ
jgi:hypothetical protein